MTMRNVQIGSIDEYHAQFPPEIQKILQQIRQAIRQAAPNASETISYGMPAFRQNKVLAYYAAHTKHIGFYPTSGPIAAFKDELGKYKFSKGAIQFPLEKPLPLALIKKIVKYRVTAVEQTVKPKSAPALKKPIPAVSKDTQAYNNKLSASDKATCDLLAREINSTLPEAENKIWHGHPVWFLEGNPVVGYSKLKDAVRLLFWSGQSFDEPSLQKEGSFKAAEARYTSASQLKPRELRRWLKKSRDIQWDYKNIVKRKGVLERIK